MFLLKISQIKVNPNNPRFIKDEKFKKLVKSIEEFPEMLKLRPIVIDENNMVLGGNMRFKACEHLKMKEVWVERAEDLSDEKKNEFIVKDNVGFGEWDWEILGNLFDDYQLGEWGLDIPEFAGVKQIATDDNFEVPADGFETDIKQGDLIEIGQHRLLCGDSTKEEDVSILMDGKLADMVFTDPPYGVSAVNVKKEKDTGGGGKLGFTGVVGIVAPRAYMPIKGDDTIDVAKDFYLLCQKLGFKKYIIWGGNYFTEFLPASRCWLIWDKKEMDMDSTFADCEIAWVSMDGNSRIYRHLWAGLLRKGDRKLELNERVHPTQKPVTLFINIMQDYEFSVCYDGFLGSGSTMVAAHQLNRNCYGMELDPKYCQVIINRMLNLDSELVIKINGKPYIQKDKS